MQVESSVTVSVLTTVYNGEQFVAEMLESIQNQTLDDFEHLIIDDGSEDATPEILQQAARDPRVRLIPAGRTGHRAKMLNRLIGESRGRYIAILDADDYAFPERLEKQVAFLENNRDVGLLGTGCMQIDIDTGDQRPRVPLRTDREIRGNILRQHPFVHSTVMFPRRVIVDVGGYNEEFATSEDYELYFRIAEKYKMARIARSARGQAERGLFSALLAMA